MRLPSVLARVLRRSAPSAERAHYEAAEGLERATQAHYRSVTGVDSQGRSTKPQPGRDKQPK